MSTEDPTVSCTSGAFLKLTTPVKPSLRRSKRSSSCMAKCLELVKQCTCTGCVLGRCLDMSSRVSSSANLVAL